MVISASPSLLSSPPLFHSLSFSFCFSLLIFLSVSLARPNGSLRSSSFFLVHLALERLFLPSPSLPLRTLLSLRLILLAPTHSFARSLGEAYTSRHFSYSVVPSSVLSPPHLSSPRSTLFSPLSFSPSSSLSFSRLFSHLLSSDSFAHLYLCPLFSLLVCFPLPVGNCTLSLLPSRRFPPVRTCHCSSIRFRVFLPTTATLPPPSPPTTSSSPRFTLSLVHARCPLHPSYAARFFTTGSQPRARARARATKRRRSRSPASARSPQAGLRI